MRTRKHISKSLIKPQTQEYECSFCNFKTKYKWNYTRHLKTNRHFQNMYQKNIGERLCYEKSIKKIEIKEADLDDVLMNGIENTIIHSISKWYEKMKHKSIRCCDKKRKKIQILSNNNTWDMTNINTVKNLIDNIQSQYFKKIKKWRLHYKNIVNKERYEEELIILLKNTTTDLKKKKFVTRVCNIFSINN